MTVSLSFPLFGNGEYGNLGRLERPLVAGYIPVYAYVMLFE